MLFTALALGADEADGAADRVLTDFGDGAAVSWVTVNDGVMGGRSQGDFRVADGVLRFAGTTNTNGGGFSSIRSRGAAFDLTGYEGIRLRVRGDGRRYTFRLTTSTTRQGRRQPSYWADFETRKDAGWQIVDVAFRDFAPQWRGQRLRGPALDLSAIDGLGLMIYDKRDGPFLLEVDWVGAYRARAAFSMANYRGRARPLLVFAPQAQDLRLARQVRAIEATRARFDERDMVLIVVPADGAARAGDIPLTPEEARTLRDAYGVADDSFAVRLVGKDGGVKRAASELLDPAALYAIIDGMPMRQREMRRPSDER